MRYQQLRADLWRVGFNYEAICANTSNYDRTEMRVDGEFRTSGDYIGLYYDSKDNWAHNYSKYNTRTNYTDVIMTCRVEYDGKVAKFNNYRLSPSLIITYEDDSEAYVTLGFLGNRADGVTFGIFDAEIELDNAWLIVGSVRVGYLIGEVMHWDAVVGTDYEIDYVRGRLFTSDMSVIPYGVEVRIEYVYSNWYTDNHMRVEFDDLYSGTHHSDHTKVSSTNIKRVTIPIIPDNYTEGQKIMSGTSDEFGVRFYEFEVTGGLLNEESANKTPHGYQMAEGYDDEYDKNPRRLVEMMKQLGYDQDVNFYIGASHFYNKSGLAGEVSGDHHDMVLDQHKTINRAYRAWFTEYVKTMKRLGFKRIVVSVSMECLQMPHHWRQRMADGAYGATGWEPPTNFYSPTNLEIQTFIRRISKAIIDIARASGLQTDLQLGESWWWWQEFAPADVNATYEGQPPCFYDDATVARYELETGKPMPIYPTSYIDTTPENMAVGAKLLQYLGEYTLFMKSIAQEYPDVLFTTLFFPPSVLDPERVPEMIRYVNYPLAYWGYPELDYIQIEDYDWVITDNPLHNDVYSFAYSDMGYSYEDQDYLSGFVLKAENAEPEWKLIERAGQQAKGRGYRTVFIWAGTQVRRDSWMPMEHTVIPDTARFDTINREKEV